MTQQDQHLERTAIAAQERDTVRKTLAASVGPKRAKQLVDGQTAEVVAKLSDKQVQEVLAAAAQIADDADAEFDSIRPRRDEITLSLALFENDRGLSTKLGLSRQRVHEMKQDALRLTEDERKPGPSCSKAKIAMRFCGCEGHWLNNHSPEEIATRAKKVGIKHLPAEFARRQLDELSATVLRAEERKKIGLEIRDNIIRATDPVLWSRDRLAAIIQKNPSQISRIRGRGTIVPEKVPA